MAQNEFDIAALQSAISAEDAGWEAGVTEFTAMSPEEQMLRLGYTPGPGEPSLEGAESEAQANLAVAQDEVAMSAAPPAFDLRDVDGKSYITSVKNQGSCGSCVAFGTLATMEGTQRYQQKSPNLAIDYSEAQLFYCHARTEGRRCGGSNGGWWSSKALDSLRDKGVVDEACYPYTAGDQNCTGLCSDHGSRTTKIKGWKRLTSHAKIKEWLSTRGPAVACYTVYQDFMAYRSGIYKHVSGTVVGGHCVSCVGYSDAGGYWICKNSWGSNWGESGYFRIAYGQVGIDNGMDVIEHIPETGWLKNTKITALWAIAENRNAWVAIQGVGWRKISFANDNIFFNILSQLIAAKAGNRPVNVYQTDKVITEVYVF